MNVKSVDNYFVLSTLVSKLLALSDNISLLIMQSVAVGIVFSCNLLRIMYLIKLKYMQWLPFLSKTMNQ